MQILLEQLASAADDLEVASFGETTVLFEPTAARCSSSSSTCCIGCISLS